MADHELAMLSFTRLARLSQEKQQAAGRDRFLVLAGRAACMAAFLDVAAACREVVLAANARHFLSGSASFPEALRQADQAGFFAALDRFCSFEQAEHLLRRQGMWFSDEERQDPATTASADLALLRQHGGP